MNKKELRELVIDIGYLVQKHTDNHHVDISRVMDELNTMESYKPLQRIMKEAKLYNTSSPPSKHEKWFGIIVDLLGYDKNKIDNTTLGHIFDEIATLKSKSDNASDEEYD